MTSEEAQEYAKTMTFRDAIYNLKQARCIPYRKATFIKIDELLMALEQEPCSNCIEFKRYAKQMGFEIEQEPKTIPIPKNATNGDVIKFMFPNARVCNIYLQKDDEVYYVFIDNAKGCTIEMRVMKSWWNTPYKEG